MLVHTDYLWFNTKQRQEFIRITDEVAAIVKTSGVTDGTVLVSAMHITSGVYVNDWEDGLISDFQVWLEKLAPSGLDYQHHRTGEDNAGAHLKRTIMGHQVVVPITGGTLDLGPWEQIVYAEFDGRRKKRVVIKVMGIQGSEDLRKYPERPIAAVGAVILDGDRVLLVQRRQEPLEGEWSLPGGAVEIGETLEAALAREVREETSLDVVVGPVVEVLDSIRRDAGGRAEYHYIIIDYACRVRRGTSTAATRGTDAADVRWVPVDELDRYRLTDTALAVIRKARA
jgi:secondary thiamine-phosphate synthase enzyme